MKNEIKKMLSSSDKLDLNKVSLFMTMLVGMLLTTYAVVTHASFAEAFFITMIGAGAGTTVSKGIVDTLQRKKDEKDTSDN